MLLSWQVPQYYKLKPITLEWAILEEKIKHWGGVEDTRFLEKSPEIVLIFLCTPGNVVKLCTLHSSEISRPKYKTPGNFK